MTIHWLDSDTNLIILSGLHAVTTAIVSKAMFFHSVCVLVSLTASPKHPQSLMGLAMASHSVTAVITESRPTVAHEVCRRLMANSRNMPRQNSTAANPIEKANSTQSGRAPSRPTAFM